MPWLLTDHIQWIFSGIGVFVLTLLVRWWSRKEAPKEASHNINVKFSQDIPKKEKTPEEQGYIPMYDQICRINAGKVRLSNNTYTNIVLCIEWKVVDPLKFLNKYGKLHPIDFIAPYIVSEIRNKLVKLNKGDLYEDNKRINRELREVISPKFKDSGLHWISSYFESME
jgi:regulator of protease activity HflC (stomatin/prohibitin superfamily)